MRKTNFVWLVIAMLVLGATSALAGPIISVEPAIPTGPINCSDSVTYTVHYNPNDYTGELLGYSIDLTNSGSDYVTFGTTDVVFGAWPAAPTTFATSIGSNAVRVDATALGAAALAAGEEADLFTITVHGAATGAGQLNLSNVTLTRPTGQNITPDPFTNPMGTITVDCDAPAVPVMVAEPAFTAGTTNQVFWSAVTDPSGGVEYNVRADDGTTVVESGWVMATDHTFTGLVHGVTYTYDVQARDGLGNTSAFSGTVSSTQDDVTPESSVQAFAQPAYATYNLPIAWTASDDLSGVAHVQLMYQVDGGGYMPYGTTHSTSPINFVATMDGDYDFYTVAVDLANNVEQNPEADAQSVTLDTTAPVPPMMDPEPPFTLGLENTVSWQALPDAVEYEVRINGAGTSGWISDLMYTFTGLVDATAYTYDVRARDALGNVGNWSTPVETSTQDDSAPVSNVSAPAGGNLSSLTIPITVMYADPNTPIGGSGTALIRLYYNLNNGGWVQFGSGFAPGSVINFVSPGDGTLVIYSIAEDAVGNVEMAPVSPDQTYLIDTMGPAGTFDINGGDAYTTNQVVDINCPMTDANLVVMMRLSNDAVTWSAWMPYVDPYVGWDMGAGDGTRTVYGEFQDGTGQVSSFQDDIILDTVAPPAVTGLHLNPAHELIAMDWTETDPGDLAEIEIWASLYDDVQDAEGNSVYPEYTDAGIWPAPGNPSGMPTVATHLDPDDDWYLLATVTAGEGVYDHAETSPWARGVYSYYVFAKDHAGNYSPAHSQWSMKAVNYILGDFDEDGSIGIGPDVTPFAYAYGSVDGDPEYDGVYDIGPLSGGYPSTDNYIGFEDLMLLTINYNAQPTKAAVGDPEAPVLTWYQTDENTWVLGLMDPTNSLKGVRLVSKLPTNVTADVTMAEGLGSGYFLGTDERHGLDAGFAVLGRNAVFPGTGEILRVETSAPVDLTRISVEVRDYNNESIEFELLAEPLVVLPSVYSIDNNYPNPFNPETSIKFALPEAQDVRLEIFNIRGQRVRTLVSEGMAAGHHTVIWNGTDQSGRHVASGTYFYRIQAGPLNETHRMMLVK